MKKTVFFTLLLLLVAAPSLVLRPGARVGARMPTTDSNIASYALPQTVGVAQIAYSAAWHQKGFDYFTTKQLFDELSYHGIRAVRLWLSVPYWNGVEHPTDPWLYPDYQPVYEDMNEVWGHPDVDVIVVAFINHGHAHMEEGCQSGINMSWPSEPTMKIADFLYRKFGDQDKIIIINNPESDNQWRGFDCNQPDKINFDSFWGEAAQNECLAEKTLEECVYEMAMIRYDYAFERIRRRQEAVQTVRANYPDAKLQVRTAATISVSSPQDKYFGEYMLSRIHMMNPSPDYIGLSHWKGHDGDLYTMVKRTRRITGYPIDRIFVDQIGQDEKRHGDQYPVIYGKTHQAWEMGVNLVLVWNWRQTWHKFTSGGLPRNKGMWSWITTKGRVEWGEPNSGLGAIYDLNEEADDE